jgi:hypothetical protein
MEILNKLADKKTKKPLTEANVAMDSPSLSEEDFSNDAPQGAEVEAMIMATAVSMDSIFGQMPEGVIEPVIPTQTEQPTKQTTPATLKTLKSLYDAYNKKYGNDKVKGGDLSQNTVEFLTSEGVFRELDNQTRLDGINFIYNGFKEAQPELTIEQISLDIINSLETSLDSIVTSIKGLKESNCI